MNRPILLKIFFLLESKLLHFLSAFMTFPIVFALFHQVQAQCGENILTDKDYLTCSTNHKLDSSMSAFPSFLKNNKVTKLTVETIFNPITACTPISSTKDLFVITIKDSSNQQSQILRFFWNNGAVFQAVTSVGSSPNYAGFTSPTVYTPNNWIELVAAIDFDNKHFNVGVNVPGLHFYYDSNPTISFYSSALGFDSNTKFYFCSSVPGVFSGANFHCKIKTLNIWYTFANGNYGRGYFGSLTPTLVGYYRMDENTGSQISDATGALAQGNFGTPSVKAPTWSSTTGLDFTTSNQFIQLPAFPTTSTNSFTSQSFTINFWFKFDTAPGGTNIFRYTTTSDDDNFGLYIDTSKFLTIAMGNMAYSSTSITAITPFVWTLITASYSVADSSYSSYSYLFLYLDQTRVCQTNFVISAANFATSSFKVLLGGPNGFLGSIAHFRIFSPAMNYVFDATGCPSSSSTPSYAKCDLNLGIIDLSSCIAYPCGGVNCDQCSSSTPNSCMSCASGYDYYEDPSLCTVPETPSTPENPVNPVIKPTQTSTSVLTKVYNAITKGSTTGFSAAVAGKIFSNIKYLDIGYSADLQRALMEWKSSFVSVGLDLDPPQGLQDHAPELGVPPTFEKYDVSSDFLINFWEGFIVLLFMIGLFAVFRALEYLLNASKHRILPSIKKARYMSQNLLYSQFYGIFADIVMFSILNYRTQNLGEGLASLGFALSALVLIITAFVLAFQFDLLVRYQRTKTNKSELDTFLQGNQGSFISFQDFKDTSLFRQSFVFLLVLRDFLFSLILTTLFEHPLAQTILILVLNLAVIALLLWSQPFKERCGFFQQVYYELVTLAVNICVIILAFKDNVDLEAYDLRQSTGKFIIITNLVFNFTVIVFLLYGIFLALREAYQNYKTKKSKKITPVSLHSEPSHLVSTSRNEEIELKNNQTIILNSEISSLHQKNRENGEWGFRGINNSTVGNDISEQDLQENQISSLIDMQRRIDRHHLNRRYNQARFPQDQRESNNSNNNFGVENNETLQNQSQMYSHHQSLNYSQRQGDQRRRVRNIRNKERS